MTYGPGWAPPPAPAPPPRAFATKWTWTGLVIGATTTSGLSLLGVLASTDTGYRGVVAPVLLVSALVPLGVGIVLAARRGSPARRGCGLGLIIGWALSPIVFAGVCFAFILVAYLIPGFPGT